MCLEAWFLVPVGSDSSGRSSKARRVSKGHLAGNAHELLLPWNTLGKGHTTRRVRPSHRCLLLSLSSPLHSGRGWRRGNSAPELR